MPLKMSHKYVAFLDKSCSSCHRDTMSSSSASGLANSGLTDSSASVSHYKTRLLVFLVIIIIILSLIIHFACGFGTNNKRSEIHLSWHNVEILKHGEMLHSKSLSYNILSGIVQNTVAKTTIDISIPFKVQKTSDLVANQAIIFDCGNTPKVFILQANNTENVKSDNSSHLQAHLLAKFGMNTPLKVIESNSDKIVACIYQKSNLKNFTLQYEGVVYIKVHNITIERINYFMQRNLPTNINRFEDWLVLYWTGSTLLLDEK